MKPGEEDFTLEEIVENSNPYELLKVCIYYYVEAISFIVMTQTTVGYGAPFKFTALEMIFIMISQFCGQALFSMIVREVF